MEFHKEEAKRSLDIADKKLSENDFNGAKRFVNKAHHLCPDLDELKQVLMMINVYISASKSGGEEEADWYGILNVDPLANDESLKKQYKKLALLLHPDKNRFSSAEGAFKLVSDAWCVLSDSSKRIAYDLKRKETRMEKPPNPPKQKAASTHRSPSGNDRVNPSGEDGPADSSKQTTFWTMCSKCKTQCEYARERFLNKAIQCPNCRGTFIATERNPWKRQCIRKKATTEKTNGVAPSSSGRKSSASSATKKTPQAANRNGTYSEKTTTSEASIPKPFVNLSSSSQQQGSSENKPTSKNTSFSFSFKATSKSRNATSSKRVLEKLRESVVAERILKKPRTQI